MLRLLCRGEGCVIIDIINQKSARKIQTFSLQPTKYLLTVELEIPAEKDLPLRRGAARIMLRDGEE